jgi:hypothetical protein
MPKYDLSAIQSLARSDDLVVRRSARVLLRRLQAMPMAEILDRVRPDRSVAWRCMAVGVSKATWYSWTTGRTRPNVKAARRLSRITGIDIAAIRGYPPQ